MSNQNLSQIESINSSPLWNHSIITPSKKLKKYNDRYLLIPTNECTLDGRVYMAINENKYNNFTQQDKDKLNLMY